MSNKNSASHNHAYLDHAASTPMFAVAREAMFSYLADEQAANPTGSHFSAQNARRHLDDSRQELADIFGMELGDVIFCSGGTESDNLAIFGTTQKGVEGTIFCSAIEHPAVLRPIQSLGGELLPVTPDGRICLESLKKFITADTKLVSIMAVNNETGIIQPLLEIAAIIKDIAPNAILHTDAAQAVMWLDLATYAKDFDLISLSAHKFGGAPGTGALLARQSSLERKGAQVAPQLLGGKQERDRRSGTPNVAGAIAMSVAAQVATNNQQERNQKIAHLRDQLLMGLMEQIPEIHITGISNTTSSPDYRVAGACHVCIFGVIGEELLFLLTENGVEASAASSCASGAQEVSSVLSAMGYEDNLAKGSLRLSLGHTTRQSHIDHAIKVIAGAATQLKRGKISN